MQRAYCPFTMEVFGTALGSVPDNVLWVADVAGGLGAGSSMGDIGMVRCCSGNPAATVYMPAAVRWGCPRGDCGACGWCLCPSVGLHDRPGKVVLSAGLAAALSITASSRVSLCCAAGDRLPVASEFVCVEFVVFFFFLPRVRRLIDARRVVLLSDGAMAEACWQMVCESSDKEGAAMRAQLLAGTVVVAGGRLALDWLGHSRLAAFCVHTVELSRSGALHNPCSHHDLPAVIGPRTRLTLHTGKRIARETGGAPGCSASFDCSAWARAIAADVPGRDEQTHAVLACIRAARGAVLLAGPAGSGKTCFVEALMRHAPLPCRVLPGASVFLAAHPARALRSLLTAISATETGVSGSCPIVVVLEDIDALASDRTLLAELHRFLDATTASYTLLATTNRLAAIPASLMRARRLGVSPVLFPAPTAEQRAAMLHRVLSRFPRVDAACLHPDAVRRLADHTPGFLPADLLRLCQQAVLLALRRQAQAVGGNGNGGASDGGILSVEVASRDFESALGQLRPSALAEVMASRFTHAALPAEFTATDIARVANVVCISVHACILAETSSLGWR
jgi:hypothetical protein